jgi:hypothetical protein
LAGRLRHWLITSIILSFFQAGVVKEEELQIKYFVIKTTKDRFLRIKRGRIYWGLVYLEKSLIELVVKLNGLN